MSFAKKFLGNTTGKHVSKKSVARQGSRSTGTSQSAYYAKGKARKKVQNAKRGTNQRRTKGNRSLFG